MNKTWKRYRVALTAAGMAACMTAGLGLGMSWFRGQVEKTTVAAAERKMKAETESGESTSEAEKD